MAGELIIRMPALSATMTEGELTRWLIDVGDAVRNGQAIAEVVTDKVDMELESPYDGTVTALVAEPGTVVQVGQPVARVASDSDDLLGGLELGGEEAGGLQVSQAPEPTPAAAAATTTVPRVPAPPPIRKRAKELGVDLALVTPTGKRGQVTNEDLERFLREREAQPRPAAGPDRRRQAVRAAGARLLTRSAAIPQFTLYRRVNLSRAVQRKQGRSWTTEIVRALAAALWRHPDVNARWDEDGQAPARLPGVRIGLAVDAPQGLVVVGLDDPDRLDPAEADRQVRAAAERARNGELRPGDTRDLSSTVSNLGGFGVDRFQALLMPPQASILSVGRVVEVPVVIDGRVQPLLSVELGLTVDHRVADGADAARMLDTLADILEG